MHITVPRPLIWGNSGDSLHSNSLIIMTINFIIRGKGLKLSKVYIRLRDGRHIDQTGSTLFYVFPEAWDNKLELLNAAKCPEELDWEKINDAIAALRKHLTRKYITETLTGRAGPRWLRDSLDEYFGANGNYYFNSAFDKFLHEHELSESRILQYEVLRRLVLRFLLWIKGRANGNAGLETDLRLFDANLLTDLKLFMETEHIIYKGHPEFFEAFPDKREPRPRGKNTINGLFKKLRTFFHWCKDIGLVDKNPFDNFKIGSDLYGTPVYLNRQEVKAIFEADLSSNPRLARQRDVFVFQCCVGCRVGDLLNFKKSNVIDGVLQYIPHKTISKNPQTIAIPLNERAKTIVERYQDSPSDKLLPFISTQKYNEAIKEICRLSGINRLVTTLDPLTRQERKVRICDIASSHMARRTFAGNIYKRVKDAALVSALTGHTDGSRSFSRYRSIDDDIKKELVGLLD